MDYTFDKKMTVQGKDIHDGLNTVYSLLSPEGKTLLNNYLSENKDDDFLNGMPFGFITGSYQDVSTWLLHYLNVLLPSYKVEYIDILEYVKDKYAESDYTLCGCYNAGIHDLFKYRDEPYIIDKLAEYGINLFDLKDSYFKNDECVKYDCNWSKVCEILMIKKNYKKVLEIAEFAAKNDAFDKTKGGWAARLEKYKKKMM